MYVTVHAKRTEQKGKTGGVAERVSSTNGSANAITGPTHKRVCNPTTTTSSPGHATCGTGRADAGRPECLLPVLIRLFTVAKLDFPDWPGINRIRGPYNPKFEDTARHTTVPHILPFLPYISSFFTTFRRRNGILYWCVSHLGFVQQTDLQRAMCRRYC